MSQLKKMNEGEIWSDDGYKITVGRHSISYSEGSYSLMVEVEHLVAPYRIVVYSQQTTEKGNSQSGGVSSREDVLGRIREALEFLGKGYEWV